jgi:hypothetical protein
MSDELRVTVVVTGLGRKKNVAPAINEIPLVPKKHNIVVDRARGVEDAVDYRKFDKPTILRNGSSGVIDELDETQAVEFNAEDVYDLDIPAFLRRDDKK